LQPIPILSRGTKGSLYKNDHLPRQARDKHREKGFWAQKGTKESLLAYRGLDAGGRRAAVERQWLWYGDGRAADTIAAADAYATYVHENGTTHMFERRMQ